MKKICEAIGVGVLFVVFIVVVAVLLALPTMWLVNYVLSDAALVAVFGGPLGFWKALALNVICGFLFRARASK